MRRAVGVEAARQLLRRVPLEDQAPPPEAQSRLRELFGENLTVADAVERIIRDIEARGDDAIREYSFRIDGLQSGSLIVSKEEIEAAASRLDPGLRDALELAAVRIRSFHEACVRKSWFDAETGLGQRIQPIERVGVYVPGGTASYASTVLHTAVPARVAGVAHIVMATPPRKDGAPPAAVLAAAHLAGVDTVLRLGGAQAIAAMALGTRTILPVDKVVGPGNVFVTIAKRKLYGRVGIDGLHGPTETMIITDESARSDLCAADLLAQAEHDVMATPILITTSSDLANRVLEEIERQIEGLERAAVARECIRERGVLALVENVAEGIQLANDFAPEHLCLAVADPEAHLDQVRHVGGLFLGEGSPEVLGDYVAGPSHAMPTGGTARFASGLGVHDFVTVTGIIGLDRDLVGDISGPAATIARAEGLTAHARAAELRSRAQGDAGRGPGDG